MTYQTTNHWSRKLGILAVMIALLTVVMTVTAQADGPDWKLPVTGLTAVAGNDPGEMIISWDAHTQTTKTLLNYRVAWTPQGEGFKSADQTDWNAHTTGTRHTVTGLDAGATYQVKVRTRYEGNQGSRWTDVMTGQAQSANPEWKLPVTGLTAVAGDNPGEMLITWDAHTQTTKTLLNYRVAWTPNGEGFKSADQTDWNTHTTGTEHTVTGLDAGEAYQVKVRTKYEGRQGSRWSDVVAGQAAAPAAPTNSAATGQPAITGTAEVGETLTAATSGIADGNGTTNAVFTFQWMRSASGSDNDITNATGSTYVVTNAEIDKAIKVRVSFTDDDGYSETLTSNATTSVPVPAPVIVPPEEPQIAQAAGDVTLVSNTGTATDPNFNLLVGSSSGNKYSQAQQFTTGDNEDGYTLSSIQIYIKEFGGSDAARISIYEADSSGKPDSSLYQLTNPSPFANSSLNTFTAPANATLAKETKYLVVAEATSGSYQIAYTSSNAEDSGKANGWSINNRRHTRDSDSGSWSLSSVGNTNIRISLSGTITPSTDITVPNNWNLKPSGLGVGDEFRLIFLSSTKRNASSASIGTYNTWIQGRAAAGHADIRTYSDGFTAVGCTAEDDARDNTGTTYTSTDKGVPIYWLNGAKVADEYQDFYDETWDEEANDKNELGTNGPNTSQDSNFPFTGCDHDGTEDFDTALATPRSKALGTIYNVRLARPNSSISGHGPLSSALNEASRSSNRPMYGLSAAFTIVEPSDDAKLSALDIEGATGSETITLNPAFAANRTNYTATVPNDIDAVTLTTTTNESNATVAITNDDDTSSKNEADLDLIVGDTTLTVTVTAQDGSTKTYTIIVTRAEDFVLVSNTGQTRSNESGAVQSQPFTTGSNLGGYTLTSVDVGFQGDNVRTRLFHIVPNQGNGEPNLSDPTKFITLTTPGTTTANKIHTFAAPADARLAANTTYHLYLANSDGGVPGNIHRVSSQAEDDGGAPGWSIGNKRYWRNGNTGPWSDDTANIVRMQINGLNALPSTDATLSGLDLVRTADGQSVSLNPAFAANRMTYTAAVANGVDEVTLTATTNHTGATIAITDDDDANTKNEADLDLIVGDNTLTVTVTAEDTSVTETYTITVTREQDPAEPVNVPIDWSLIPSGIGPGDQFRLLFLSGTRRDGSSSAITDYNVFVRGRAAAGHADIQAYSDRFMAVGCTEDVDAKDNTATTFTNSNKGVPIYWLNGNKVADEHEDFYDGDWDDESNDKNEDGNNGPNTSDSANYPLTGCSDDGTEKISGSVSSALGNGSEVTVARPNSTGAGHGPLSSGQKITETFTRPCTGFPLYSQSRTAPTRR